MAVKNKEKKKSEKSKESSYLEYLPKLSRRGFLAAAGIGALAGLTGCLKFGEEKPTAAPAAAPAAPPKHEVPPGEWDEYYGFWSGGHSGEVRILGIPSMRALKRLPVFNFDCTTGWGITEYSKKIMGTKYRTGDTHHVHLSYTDGTYDGRYAYVNDKLHARLARIRLDYMEVDAILELPNAQGTHGIFPQRAPRTGYVFCNSEFQLPQPNDGRDMDVREKYYGMHTAVDGETMELKWQVMTDGNQDLCATDYKGKYSMATCYNSEKGFTLEDMMAKDRDYLIVFNLSRIERAIKNGEYMSVGKSPIPVVDGRKTSPLFGEAVIHIPVPKSPHGVNVSPDGKYAICSGKLSPTCTVVDLAKVDEVFAGRLKPEEAIVAQPELGLGPLHTVFDGRGNAYTSIYIDSVVCKWNIEKAIRQYKGENVDPIIDKIDIHYQVGHVNASMSETKEADGRYLVSLNKFSKDRFLPVGPMHPDNDQLIDISGEKMVLLKDEPVWPEPHDCVIVKRDIILPVVKKVDDPARYPNRVGADENRVERVGERKVNVYMTSLAPKFGLTEIRVKEGDEVTLTITNLDTVEDLSHGLAIPKHDVNILINPGQTHVVKFTAGEPGVYWYFCTWFCHALHLEMRGRLLVEPR